MLVLVVQTLMLIAVLHLIVIAFLSPFSDWAEPVFRSMFTFAGLAGVLMILAIWVS